MNNIELTFSEAMHIYNYLNAFANLSAFPENAEEARELAEKLFNQVFHKAQ